MDIILIPGLWLESSAWAAVSEKLTELGHRPIPVALPGADDHNADATLEEQVAAVVAAVDGADRPLVVGHSAGCALAWLAADRRPDAVAAVALVGGFPPASGPYAPFFDLVDGVMPFPGWEVFAGPDSDDLDDATKERMARGAIPVAGAVSRGEVLLNDERRYDVPIYMICPEYTPDQAKEWLAAGDLPEVEKAREVHWIDLDSGHWPMFSQPDLMASTLHRIAAERQ